jgi:hypothetical protein
MKRLLTIGVALGIILGLILSNSMAQQPRGQQEGPVDAIAAALEKGDQKSAQQQANQLALARKEIYDFMMLLKPRREGKVSGFGIGPKPGAMNPDGIELKIRALSKGPLGQQQLKNEAAALVQAAYRVAAVGEIARFLPPKKDQELWFEYLDDMSAWNQEFIKSVRANNPAAVAKAAAGLNGICNNCHAKFR